MFIFHFDSRKNDQSNNARRPIENSENHNLQEYTYKKITPCDVCSQVLRGNQHECCPTMRLLSQWQQFSVLFFVDFFFYRQSFDWASKANHDETDLWTVRFRNQALSSSFSSIVEIRLAFAKSTFPNWLSLIFFWILPSRRQHIEAIGIDDRLVSTNSYQISQVIHDKDCDVEPVNRMFMSIVLLNSRNAKPNRNCCDARNLHRKLSLEISKSKTVSMRAPVFWGVVLMGGKWGRGDCPNHCPRSLPRILQKN